MRVHALAMGTRIGTARVIGQGPREILNQSCKREGSSEGPLCGGGGRGAGDLAEVNLAWERVRV